MKITIIGNGKMAEAIALGASKSFEVEIVARSEKFFSKDIKNILLEDSFDISGKNIILCVKPYVLEEVSKKLKGEANLLLSVLAGSTIESLKSHIKAIHTLRAMPNLSAVYLKSMTTLCGDVSYKDEAMKICESFGSVLWLGSEKELDIATAVAGSGPAYLALVAEALSDGAVKQGLKRNDADKLVQGLFGGFSPLLNEKHPAVLKDEVMSPGGTTAAGYSALEEGGVRISFIKAIQEAYGVAKG
jgi:pyrroline-5-carboxylate reductase